MGRGSRATTLVKQNQMQNQLLNVKKGKDLFSEWPPVTTPWQGRVWGICLPGSSPHPSVLCTSREQPQCPGMLLSPLVPAKQRRQHVNPQICGHHRLSCSVWDFAPQDKQTKAPATAPAPSSHAGLWQHPPSTAGRVAARWPRRPPLTCPGPL